MPNSFGCGPWRRLRSALIDFRDEFLLALGLQVVRPDDLSILRLLAERVNGMPCDVDKVIRLMKVFGRRHHEVECWARLQLGRWDGK